MRRQSLSRKFRVDLPRVLLLFFLFFLALGLLFASDYFFIIKNIRIVSDQTEDIRGVESLKGRNMIFTTSENFQKSIILLNPKLKSIRVEKIYPNTLVLYPEYYLPVANFIVNDGSLVLSEDGTIIKKIKNRDHRLPVINYYQKLDYQSLEVGEKLDYREILLATHFVVKAKSLSLTVLGVDISATDMIALNLSKGKIFFTVDNKQTLQDYRLETIIKQFKIEGKEFQTLDLRFDKPVVKF